MFDSSTVEILIIPITPDPVFNYFFTLTFSFGIYAFVIGLLVRILSRS